MSRAVASVLTAAIVAGLVAGAAGCALPAGPSICPLLALSGIPYPFCGMTRATIALGAGDLDRALALHPIAPVVLILVLAAMVSIALGRNRWLQKSPATVLGALAAIWVIKLAAG